jgi:hypothetical protein
MVRVARTGTDDPLGIGVESLVGLITPAAVIAASAAAGAVSQFLVERTYQRGRRLVRRLVVRGAPAEIEIAAVRALTAEQLAVIGRTVHDRAVECGSDAEQAQNLTDSVVAALVRRAETGEKG